MQFLLILVLGLAPGLFLLYITYRWDRYHPEPKGMVIRTFLLGMAVIIPVAIIETLLFIPIIIPNLDKYLADPINALNQLSTGQMAYTSFIIAGFTEELFKFLVVRITVYKSPYFDDATDGLVYASAAALGFATLENLAYMAQYGWQVILTRGPISTGAHLLFSILWGYPLALRKLGRKNAAVWLWLGLIGAMVAHGLFDFVLFQASWYQWLAVPLFIGMIIVLNIFLRHSRKISNYKDKVTELQKICRQCGAKVPYYAEFCSNCGTKFPTDTTSQTACGKCGQNLPANALYCTACGSRNVKKQWLRK